MNSPSDKYHSGDVNNEDTIQQGSNKGSPLLLVICASGICGCYLFFGMIQEKLFSKGSAIQESGVGNVTTFMLVLSCITNVIVSFIWNWIQDRFFTKHKVQDDSLVNGNRRRRIARGREEGETIFKKEATGRGGQTREQHQPLHHAMLLASKFIFCMHVLV
jgi:hypothetical protein